MAPTTRGDLWSICGDPPWYPHIAGSGALRSGMLILRQGSAFAECRGAGGRGRGGIAMQCISKIRPGATTLHGQVRCAVACSFCDRAVLLLSVVGLGAGAGEASPRNASAKSVSKMFLLLRERVRDKLHQRTWCEYCARSHQVSSDLVRHGEVSLTQHPAPEHTYRQQGS